MPESLTKKPELAVGAGWWDSLYAALSEGADAVYFGLKKFNLRSLGAHGFEENELKKIALACHKQNIKAYLTLNSIVYQKELEVLERILEKAKTAGIDAVIAWDWAVIERAKKVGLDIHISTQASVSNIASLLCYAKAGAKRIVLARELDLEQIKEISEYLKRKNINAGIEVFIHGAMCISISGRCFISEFFYGKSANRGQCVQPCRKKYIIKEIAEGKELEVADGYVLSPKDISTVEILDKIIESGISACKIEGRSRSAEYVSVVTSVYRRAIDGYFSGKFDDARKRAYVEELKSVYNRGFSNGFYLGRPRNELAGHEGSASKKMKKYIGEVRRFYPKLNVAEILVRDNLLRLGDRLLFTGKVTGAKEMKVESMESKHIKISHAEKGDRVAIKINFRVRVKDKVFLWQ